MAIDPVCGMEVDEKKAPFKEYKGMRYYFCSPACQWAFEMKPEQFLKGEIKWSM